MGICAYISHIEQIFMDSESYFEVDLKNVIKILRIHFVHPWRTAFNKSIGCQGLLEQFSIWLASSSLFEIRYATPSCV